MPQKWVKKHLDVPVMKGRNSFFKLYHLRPFITGTSNCCHDSQGWQ